MPRGKSGGCCSADRDQPRTARGHGYRGQTTGQGKLGVDSLVSCAPRILYPSCPMPRGPCPRLPRPVNSMTRCRPSFSPHCVPSPRPCADSKCPSDGGCTSVVRLVRRYSCVGWSLWTECSLKFERQFGPSVNRCGRVVHRKPNVRWLDAAP